MSGLPIIPPDPVGLVGPQGPEGPQGPQGPAGSGESSIPSLSGNANKVLTVLGDETASVWSADNRVPLRARYWRVKLITVGANSSNTNFGLCNLQFLNYSGTNLSTDSSKGFADSDSEGVFGGIPAAFDSITTIRHGWLSSSSSGSAYIGYDFTIPVAIHTVHFQNIDAYQNLCGGIVAVEWSEDNIAWHESTRHASIEVVDGSSPLQTITVTEQSFLLSGNSDVDLSVDPTDGQTLVFNGSSYKWKPKSPLLSSCSDVAITGTNAPADGDSLVFDFPTRTWGPGTPAGGSGGGGSSAPGTRVLIEKVVTEDSAPSVTFSAIPGSYSHLQIVWRAACESSESANTQTLIIEFNGDSDSIDFAGTGQGLYGAVAGFPNNYGLLIPSGNSAAVPFGQGTIDIYDYTDNTQEQMFYGRSASVQANVGICSSTGAGWWKVAAGITDILLKPTGSYAWKDGSTFWFYAII